MKELKKSSTHTNSERDKIRIHLTRRGGFYIDPDELFADPKVQEDVKKMSEIVKKKT